ncbi:MAG: hypothetical protein AAF447_00210 [Myxococcota bacterium]
MTHRLLALALVVFGLLPGRALAQRAAEAPSRWALDLTASTSFPLAAGGGVLLETPGRLLLDVRAGTMPRAYLGAINRALVGVGAYGESDAERVEDAIDRTFVLRLGTGFRLGKRAELMVGYTRLTASGRVATEDVVAQAAGLGADPVPVSATLHAAHVSFGGRFVLGRHVVLRVALEWVHTLGATATADIDRQDLRDEAEAFLEDTLETYGFAPALRVELGWRAIGG